MPGIVPSLLLERLGIPLGVPTARRLSRHLRKQTRNRGMLDFRINSAAVGKLYPETALGGSDSRESYLELKNYHLSCPRLSLLSP